MWYVARNAAGSIASLNRHHMAGYNDETLADDHADVVAFLAPRKPQQITPVQFLARIPPAVLPVLYANPATGVMLITLAAAVSIDLTDSAVAAGINALVPSVLTVEQAAVVLDH